MDLKNQENLLEHGIKFRKNTSNEAVSHNGKRNKNGKKRYINGAHGSGSSKMKEEYRKRRQVKSANKAARH